MGSVPFIGPLGSTIVGWARQGVNVHVSPTVWADCPAIGLIETTTGSTRGAVIVPIWFEQIVWDVKNELHRLTDLVVRSRQFVGADEFIRDVSYWYWTHWRFYADAPILSCWEIWLATQELSRRRETGEMR
jgi:hypothetical protein